MRKFTSALCAAVMALSFPVAAPAVAMPIASPTTVNSGTSANVVDVQYRRDRRPSSRGFERRGNRAYYRGHRGYREARRGYRQHNGYWFPPAAFIAGAIVGGAISQGAAPAPRARAGNAHVQWCFSNYRSYRAADNTFQPYNGPRRQCRSPYG